MQEKIKQQKQQTPADKHQQKLCPTAFDDDVIPHRSYTPDQIYLRTPQNLVPTHPTTH